MSEPIMTAKGVAGALALYDDKVVIVRKGFLSFATHGLKGDKEIYLSSISSIQFKKAGLLVNGYMQFAFNGGLEAKRGINQAIEDENTVVFTKAHQPEFEAIKAKIESRLQAMRMPQSVAVPAAPSAADEIIKLADLRDKGILTEEEFQQKKRQLLGI